MSLGWTTGCAALALLAASCAAPGAEPYAAGAPPLPHAEAPEAHGSGDDRTASEAHHEHPGPGTQTLNVFVGGIVDAEERDGYTFGVDYEYRLGERLGVGGFAESVAELERSFAVGAQVYWHAVADLVLIAGPGMERFDDDWRPIARVGAAYELEFEDGLILSPALFYDVTEGDDLLIFGFNLGVSW